MNDSVSTSTVTSSPEVILAQAPAAAQPGFMNMLPMMLIIFGIFYFFLIRPQQKEQQTHQTLLAGLQKGDKVVTASGLHGRIWEVGDATLVLEIADKVRVTVDKLAVKRKEAIDPAAVAAAKE